MNCTEVPSPSVPAPSTPPTPTTAPTTTPAASSSTPPATKPVVKKEDGSDGSLLVLWVVLLYACLSLCLVADIMSVF